MKFCKKVLCNIIDRKYIDKKEGPVMKVGLVRHFKVKAGFPKKAFISPKDIAKWLDEYEASDIEVGEADLCGVEWNKCFASDLPRAVKTAQVFYDGKIIRLKELRELEPGAFPKRNIKLPFFLWAILLRMKMCVFRKDRVKLKKRLDAVLDDILLQGKENVLIVSHAMIMMFLRRELLKRGYIGPGFKTAENGKLYVFERKA
ncbi:MAG: histidine phosphatase family protein [Clostridia bacterium]|nr:histidine phosphatase family protein [Clostridia bacterium]